MKYKVSVSFLEVYNENIRDLLNDSEEYLDLREDPIKGNSYFSFFLSFYYSLSFLCFLMKVIVIVVIVPFIIDARIRDFKFKYSRCGCHNFMNGTSGILVFP